MNILSKKNLSIMLLLTVGSAQSAVNNPLTHTQFEQHTFGAQLALGNVEYKGLENNGNGVSQFYTYYNYAFSQNISFEVGVNIGTNFDNWECEQQDNQDWDCFDVDNNLFDQNIEDIQFSNMLIAGKGTLPLSKRNSLYAKVGVQAYHYEMDGETQTVEDESGIGIYLSAGWQYQWDMGLGINVGYDAYDMGNLKTFTLNTGLNYRF